MLRLLARSQSQRGGADLLGHPPTVKVVYWCTETRFNTGLIQPDMDSHEEEAELIVEGRQRAYD